MARALERSTFGRGRSEKEEGKKRQRPVSGQRREGTDIESDIDMDIPIDRGKFRVLAVL